MTVSLKKFCEHAVEAGDGAKCQFLLKYFRKWHRIRENRENLDPQNISAIQYDVSVDQCVYYAQYGIDIHVRTCTCDEIILGNTKSTFLS